MRNLILIIVPAFVVGLAIAQDAEKPAEKRPVADNAAQQAEAGIPTAGATTRGQTAEADDAPPKGYRVKVRDGETVYCRKEKVLGSRLPEEFCFNRLELKLLEERRRSIQQEMIQRQQMCTTGSACSGGP